MAAGLKSGDRIVSVNEVPSEKLTMSGFRAQLKGPIGTRVSMKLSQSDTIVVVELGDL